MHCKNAESVVVLPELVVGFFFTYTSKFINNVALINKHCTQSHNNISSMTHLYKMIPKRIICLYKKKYNRESQKRRYRETYCRFLKYITSCETNEKVCGNIRCVKERLFSPIYSFPQIKV